MPIVEVNNKRPRLAEGVFVAPNAYLTGDIVVGRDTSFWYSVVARGDVNFIRIGEKCSVQDSAVLHVTYKKYPLFIGNEVVIAHRAVVHGCELKDKVLVGIGAIVLDGAVLEEGSWVAAGSVVTPGTVIPPYTLAVGTPARVKRELTSEEIQSAANIVERYVNLKNLYLGISNV